jgi:hypothetical protein
MAELTLIWYAHYFNRFYSIIGMFMCCLVGAYRYDEMLWCLGYRTMQHTLTPLEKFRFGVVFMVTYILALGAMIATT